MMRPEHLRLSSVVRSGGLDVALWQFGDETPYAMSAFLRVARLVFDVESTSGLALEPRSLSTGNDLAGSIAAAKLQAIAAIVSRDQRGGESSSAD